MKHINHFIYLKLYQLLLDGKTIPEIVSAAPDGKTLPEIVSAAPDGKSSKQFVSNMPHKV